MFLYVTDYWVPHPTSEYGGLVIWAAENEQKIFDKIFNDLSFMDVIQFLKLDSSSKDCDALIVEYYKLGKDKQSIYLKNLKIEFNSILVKYIKTYTHIQKIGIADQEKFGIVKIFVK